MQSQTHHIQSLLRAGMGRITVRWRAAWNEKHAAQTALLQRFLRQTQVSVVDGVKSAAKYSDRCDAHYANKLLFTADGNEKVVD